MQQGYLLTAAGTIDEKRKTRNSRYHCSRRNARLVVVKGDPCINHLCEYFVSDSKSLAA